MLQTEPGEVRAGADGQGRNRPARGRGKSPGAENPCRAWRRRTRRIRATPSSKSAPGRADRNRPCSRPISTACITRYAEARGWKVENTGFQPVRPRRLQGNHFPDHRHRMFSSGSNTRAACIASSACRRPRRRGASTPARHRGRAAGGAGGGPGNQA